MQRSRWAAVLCCGILALRRVLRRAPGVTCRPIHPKYVNIRSKKNTRTCEFSYECSGIVIYHTFDVHTSVSRLLGSCANAFSHFRIFGQSKYCLLYKVRSKDLFSHITVYHTEVLGTSYQVQQYCLFIRTKYVGRSFLQQQ